MITKIFLFLLLTTISVSNKAFTQIHVNVNIGTQPIWGPSGYDHVDYYYLPDIETYYYVPTRKYTYLESSRWVTGASLPLRYRNYDLYNGYKVVVNEPKPYLHHENYRAKYISFKNRHDQPMLRDKRFIEAEKYNNGNHSNGNRGRGIEKQERHGNGNQGRGNGKKD